MTNQKTKIRNGLENIEHKSKKGLSIADGEEHSPRTTMFDSNIDTKFDFFFTSFSSLYFPPIGILLCAFGIMRI